MLHFWSRSIRRESLQGLVFKFLLVRQPDEIDGQSAPHLGRSLDVECVIWPIPLKWKIAETLRSLCVRVAFAESAETGSQDKQWLGTRAVGKKTVSERYLERAARSISAPPKLTRVKAERSFQNMCPASVKKSESAVKMQMQGPGHFSVLLLSANAFATHAISFHVIPPSAS